MYMVNEQAITFAFRLHQYYIPYLPGKDAFGPSLAHFLRLHSFMTPRLKQGRVPHDHTELWNSLLNDICPRPWWRDGNFELFSTCLLALAIFIRSPARLINPSSLVPSTDQPASPHQFRSSLAPRSCSHGDSDSSSWRHR